MTEVLAEDLCMCCLSACMYKTKSMHVWEGHKGSSLMPTVPLPTHQLHGTVSYCESL